MRLGSHRALGLRCSVQFFSILARHPHIHSSGLEKVQVAGAAALWASIILPAVVLAKMYRCGLIMRYRWFSTMLFIGVLRDVPLAILNPESAIYEQIWLITLIPWLIAQIAASIGAYFSLAKFYKGMGAFAGWLYATGALAGFVICAVINKHAYDAAFYSFWVGGAAIAERSTATILTCATVVTCAFLSRFPNPLQRMPANLIGHLILLTFFFGITSLFQFVIGNIIEQNLERATETIFFLLITLSYALWAVTFSEEGEIVLHWPDIDPRIRRQVEELNFQLMRVTREISLRSYCL